METEQQLTKKIQKAAIVPGIIYGVVSLIMAIFSFYFTITMAGSLITIVAGSFVFSLVIPIIVAIFLVIDLRKKIGGYWNFRQAVTGIFIMFLISTGITFVGHNLVFAKVIEPNMIQKMEDRYVSLTETMMEKTGAEQTKIDDQVEKVKANFESKKDESVGGLVKGLAIAIIITFVFALIFAAIFKRDPPMFEPVSTNDEQ